jgi:phosphoserine aminotransferase
MGGMEEIGRRNERKSEKLYSFLDQSKLYSAPVAKEFRSRMNVDFRVRASGAGIQSPPPPPFPLRFSS